LSTAEIASIQLLQPVTVKVVMTASFRAQMISEVQFSLDQIEENLRRLSVIAESVDNAEGERRRVESEFARLTQAREELGWRIREAQSLQDGAEIFYQNVTSTVTVQVGDDYQAWAGREIIVKDGKVIKIRSGAAD
jgi:hypothetical protein